MDGHQLRLNSAMRSGVFWKAEINRELVAMARTAEGRHSQPSASVIDSQSVKTTESGGVRGYDAGKRIKGRKQIDSF